MSLVCGMTFLSGSISVKAPLLQAGTLDMTSDVKAPLNPNKQQTNIYCFNSCFLISGYSVSTV